MRRWAGFIERRPWELAERLWIVADDDGVERRRVLVEPLQFRELKALEPPDEATLADERGHAMGDSGDVRGFLRAMLELAWAEGIRPAGFGDHANELTAVRYHLEDMRRLAKVPGAAEAKR